MIFALIVMQLTSVPLIASIIGEQLVAHVLSAFMVIAFIIYAVKEVFFNDRQRDGN